MLGQDKRRAPFVDRLAVAGLDRFTCLFAGDGEVPFVDCQKGAGNKPHQIGSVSGWPSFGKVIDTPDQTTFAVTPGAEVLHVEIADGEDLRSLGQFGADQRPELGPSVKRGAEKWEDSFGHEPVLEREVAMDKLNLLAGPALR